VAELRAELDAMKEKAHRLEVAALKAQLKRAEAPAVKAAPAAVAAKRKAPAKR
jgi:peptidoglycan hydrolase CwlO-like protein